MTKACEWVKQVAGTAKPVLVAYPLSFDWTWLYWYFIQYSKSGSPFDYSRCFDIKTALAVKAGIPIAEASRSRLDPLLQSRHQHTHHAVDDAIAQAEIFANVFEWRGSLGELTNRRSQTEERISALRGKLAGAEKIAAEKACVYATGSFGRREASIHSDLDLFIVSKMGNERGTDGKPHSLLKRLDDIRIKADLIEVTQELKIPEFSGDGKYLVHYSVQQLTETLGKPEDDALNTFTARLLLLLESHPLLEASVYKDVIEEVVAPYWKDFADHKGDFVPAFLTNDILRLWRTFCVNYEANTSSEPTEENAKRKSKNYKLKHSRLLTCYSALLYLLAIFRRQNTVKSRRCSSNDGIDANATA